VLEIDGKVHERQREYDEFRTFIINQLGIRVVRVTNEAVADTEKFVEWLKRLT
jgi:very-short-patch-repair endonuclease